MKNWNYIEGAKLGNEKAISSTFYMNDYGVEVGQWSWDWRGKAPDEKKQNEIAQKIKSYVQQINKNVPAGDSDERDEVFSKLDKFVRSQGLNKRIGNIKDDAKAKELHKKMMDAKEIAEEWGRASYSQKKDNLEGGRKAAEDAYRKAKKEYEDYAMNSKTGNDTPWEYAHRKPKVINEDKTGAEEFFKKLSDDVKEREKKDDADIEKVGNSLIGKTVWVKKSDGHQYKATVLREDGGRVYVNTGDGDQFWRLKHEIEVINKVGNLQYHKVGKISIRLEANDDDWTVYDDNGNELKSGKGGLGRAKTWAEHYARFTNKRTGNINGGGVQAEAVITETKDGSQFWVEKTSKSGQYAQYNLYYTIGQGKRHAGVFKDKNSAIDAGRRIIGNRKLYWNTGTIDWDVAIFNGQWYITMNGQKLKGPFPSMKEAERYLDGHKWELQGKYGKAGNKTGNKTTQVAQVGTVKILYDDKDNVYYTNVGGSIFNNPSFKTKEEAVKYTVQKNKTGNKKLKFTSKTDGKIEYVYDEESQDGFIYDDGKLVDTIKGAGQGWLNLIKQKAFSSGVLNKTGNSDPNEEYWKKQYIEAAKRKGVSEKEIQEFIKKVEKEGPKGIMTPVKNSASDDKFAYVMREFDAGKLKTPDGKVVTDPAQAKAIAYSESKKTENGLARARKAIK